MTKRNFRVIFLVAFTTLHMFHPGVFAYTDNESTRSSLQGLKGMYVWVALSTPAIKDLKKMGLSEEVIRTDVELQLRNAGINVIPEKDLYTIPGWPRLSVDILGCVTAVEPKTQDKVVAFAIRIELMQNTRLTRKSTQKAYAVTWSIGGIGHCPTDKNIVAFIRNEIKGFVANFITAYLSVNPKEGK